MPGFEWIGKEERNEVNQVLDNGVLMRYGFDKPRKGIWKAIELENLIQQKLGIKYAQLTSSGTTALITGLHALGVGAGDQVILPTFTFVASFEAVLAVNAIPIFVNIDNSLTMNPQEVEKAITTKTKVLMPVHMCGAMAEMDELKKICKRHGLLLFEDACQAIGATYKGKPLGTIGDIGCFSFDYVKTITCGEGGVVLSNNKKYYKRSDGYTDHGHDHKGIDRGADEHPFLGLNFRISELNAAVGVAQWKKLDKIIAVQRRNKRIIKEYMEGIKGLKFREIHDSQGDNASFISWFLDNEDWTVRAYKSILKNKITGVFYWYNNNWHYIKKWNHLKNLKTLSLASEDVVKGLPDYKNQDFVQSDDILSRTLTSIIQLSWTEEQSKERALQLKNIIEQTRKI